MRYDFIRPQARIVVAREIILQLVILMFTLLLSACGFHLRGTNNMPHWLNHIAIVSEQNDKQFLSIITSRLELSNVHVNSEPFRAKYWLVVNEISLQQQMISVGASTNPRQYTLTLTMQYKLSTRKGRDVAPLRKVSVSRQLTLNNNRILGSKDEESILIGEMKQDAVTQLLYQLAHLQH